MKMLHFPPSVQLILLVSPTMLKKNSSARLLQEHLATMPYKDVRAIATRLGLRQWQHGHKSDWIAQIEGGWHCPAQRQRWLDALSPGAQAAIVRLLQAQQIPAALFWGEYGPLRRVRTHQHWTPPPWQAPASVSEELYYSGLLCSLGATTLPRACQVALPVDLHAAFTQSLAPLTARAPAVAPTSSPPLPSTWMLCHDLGQWLIYLHSQPGLHLLHDRWLTRTQGAALNQRLVQPVTVKPFPSHRRSPYLRLLSFLAVVGELQTQAVLTPKGWDWLAATPAAQLGWLWQAWSDATPEQRQHYALPDAAVGASRIPLCARPGPCRWSF
jgi:hypothetical protein